MMRNKELGIKNKESGIRNKAEGEWEFVMF
jgi:hypothetical protein